VRARGGEDQKFPEALDQHSLSDRELKIMGRGLAAASAWCYCGRTATVYLDALSSLSRRGRAAAAQASRTPDYFSLCD
jgi:hypothetical protein